MLTRTNRIHIMMLLNGGFFIVEIVIGYYVSSLSLIADSFHMLNDLISLMVALWAIRLANQPHQQQSKYSYGWQRAEILGALLNGVFLLALCFTILMEAIQRFIHMEPMSNPEMVLITGGAGLVANILGLFLFHEHGHGHQHESTSLETQSTHNHHQHNDSGHLNTKGIFLHVLGDALGNIGVMAAALFIWLTPFSWRFYMDPIISLVIAVIIFGSAIPLVKATSSILLQGVPDSVNFNQVRETLLQIPGVYSIHELHIWQLSDTKVIASLHVLLSEENYMELSIRMRQTLHEFGVHSATIQPEFFDATIEKQNQGGIKYHSSSSTLSVASKDNITIQGTDTLLDNMMDGNIGDSSTCLLRCIDTDSCYEKACCPPPYK
ncbi:cation efflux family-domain-containing protein [Chlamydoabsidia padenii]|nr:cation efflux family-domain-containing protein [Chlamydoabsidia padenii]